MNHRYNLRFYLALILVAGLLRWVEASAPNLKYGKVFYRIGLDKIRDRHPSEALAYYHKAIEADPGLPEAYHEISKIHFERKEYNLAIQYAQEAVYSNPLYHQAYTDLGHAYREGRYYQKAVDAFKKALELYNHYPYTPQYIYNLGSAYAEVKDYENARTHLQNLKAIGENDLAQRLQREIPNIDK